MDPWIKGSGRWAGPKLCTTWKLLARDKKKQALNVRVLTAELNRKAWDWGLHHDGQSSCHNLYISGAYTSHNSSSEDVGSWMWISTTVTKYQQYIQSKRLMRNYVPLYPRNIHFIISLSVRLSIDQCKSPTNLITLLLYLLSLRYY